MFFFGKMIEYRYTSEAGEIPSKNASYLEPSKTNQKIRRKQKWLHRLRHWIAVTPMSTHSWIIVTIILKIYIIIIIMFPMRIAGISTRNAWLFPQKSHQPSLCYCFSSKTPAKAELLIYQHSIVLSLPGWYRAVPVVTFQEEIQEDSNLERKLNLLIIPKTTRTTSQAALRGFFSTRFCSLPSAGFCMRHFQIDLLKQHLIIIQALLVWARDA